MKRRNFFKNVSLSALGTVVPFKGELLSFNDELLASALTCGEINDRILVIVRLQGANDGLNTFVPDGQYGQYSAKRPKIKLARNKLTSLDSTAGSRKNVLLHPAIKQFKGMYENGNMSLIHAVGYKNYNYSHFASDQVLWRGSDENASLKDGLLARYISKAYKVELNEGIKNGKDPDPYAIQFGNPAPIVSFRLSNGTLFEFNGDNFLKEKIALEKSNSQVSALVDSGSTYNQLINYIKKIDESSSDFIEGIEERYDKGGNSVEYGSGKLNSQLRMVARLIKGKSKTKIYQCTLTGFDTHAGQVNLSDTTTGLHANLLSEVSTAIDNFLKDLNKMKLDKRVVLMSYSEFGRTVTDNGSGTDHGNLNPMFLMGPAIKKGILGIQPDLTKIDSRGRFDEKQTLYNFKDIYASILRDWLGANDSIITAAVGSSQYGKNLSLIDNSQIAKTTCSLANVSAREASEENVFTSESATQAPVLEYTAYPNPTSRVIYLKASDSSLKGKIQTTLYDEGGHVIYSQPYDLGSNSGIDLDRFPSGIYFLRTEDPVFGSSTHKIIKE